MEEEFTVSVTGPGVNVTKTVPGPVALRALQLLWGGSAASMPGSGLGTVQSAVVTGEELSIGEFLAGSKAGTNPEKIAAIALYLREHAGQQRVKKEELPSLFSRAGEPPPKNPTRDLQSAIVRRLVAEDPAAPGEYFVTQTGVAVVRGSAQESSARVLSGGTRRRKRKQAVEKEGEPSSPQKPKRKAKPAGDGPLGQVRALADEGWFATPRPVPELLTELANRGTHLKDSDLTRPMLKLVKDKQLRRKKLKVAGGTKEIWHYSNW